MMTHSRYQILERIGHGTMGQVFIATDRLSSEKVALKRLLTDGSPQTALTLAHEFQILAGLRHPHVIAVRDYGFSEDDHTPFFTMRLLNAPQTLVTAAQGCPLPDQVALLAQCLEALAYIHRRGLVHRDVKPGNVLVESGNVFILDFGLSAYADNARGRTGTLAYIAPEVLLRGQSTFASDLYAVGVMAYELLTGALPFAQADVSAIMNQAADLTPLADHPLAGWAATLLHKDPAARYPSANAALIALHAAAGLRPPAQLDESREAFLRAASFVGREAETDQLMGWVKELQTDSAALKVVAIGGESGIGKSRLLDEIRIRALTSGVPVLRGQAADQALLYQEWAAVMRSLLLLVEVSPFEASVLLDLVPDIAEVLQHPVTPAPPLTGGTYRQRLQQIVIELLSRVERPFVIMLEDMHWAQSSLEVLRLLRNFAPALPVLVLVTYRSDEAPDLPDQLPSVERLLLKPLDTRAITALAHSMIGEAAQRESVLDFLQKETEGNCFFLVEVVRTLAEETGSLETIGLQTLPPALLPERIVLLVERRLNRIPAWAQPTLSRLGVAGRLIDSDLLHYFLPDADEREQWLNVVADAAVIEYGDDGWRFAHDKLREVLISGISAETLQQIHSELATALATLKAEDVRYLPMRLYHLIEAGDSSALAAIAERAVTYRTLTAPYGEVLPQIDRVLALLPPDANAVRIKLMARKANTLGLLGRLPEGESLSAEAIAEAEALGDIALLGECLNYQMEMNQHHGRFAENEALAREMLPRFPAETYPVARGFLLHWYGWALLELGRYREALEANDECMKVTPPAELIKNRENSLRLLILLELGTDPNLYTLARSVVEEDRESGQYRQLLGALNNLAKVCIDLKRFDEALAAFTEMHDLGRRLNIWRAEAVAATNIGLLYTDRSNTTSEEYERALYYLNRALELNKANGVTSSTYTLRGIGEVLTRLGRFDQAEAPLLEALAIARSGSLLLDQVESLQTLTFHYFTARNVGKGLASAREMVALLPKLDSLRVTVTNLSELVRWLSERGFHAFAVPHLAQLGRACVQSLKVEDKIVALRLAAQVIGQSQPERAAAFETLAARLSAQDESAIAEANTALDTLGS